MKLALAGLRFVVGPDGLLTVGERAALVRLDEQATAFVGLPFRLEIEDRLPADETIAGAGRPAEVHAEGRLVRLAHRDFEAALDARRRLGVLRRDPAGTFPLEVTLRTAMCCLLPLAGGVALHAGGAVLPPGGVVFFGPSGAGKSTAATCCPYSVLSDELVAVRGDPLEVRATGFWGELASTGASVRGAPLAAVVELAKGPRLSISPLAPEEAFRRLLSCIVLPASDALWNLALANVARLVRAVPCLRLSWSPARSPWEDLPTAIEAAREPASNRRRSA